MSKVFYSLLMGVFLMMLTSCGSMDSPYDPDDTGIKNPERVLEYDLPDYWGELFTTGLIAGQDFENPIGEVRLVNDGENIYIQVVTNDPWRIGVTHLDVAENLDDIPHNKSWNPKIGQFAYDTDDYVSLGEFTEGIETLYVALHAEVQKLDENGNVIQEETAWGNGIDLGGNSWALYFIYTVVLEPPIDCTPGWANSWGGNAYDVIAGVEATDSGFVYVSGYFGSTVDFDPGEGVANGSSNGNEDAYVSKFDSEGTFYWSRQWGGSGREYGVDVTSDSLGNIYVGGYFEGTVDFDPGDQGFHEVNSNEGQDAFVLKLDAEGEFQWVQTWGGSQIDRAVGISAGASDFIYVTGWNTNSNRSALLKKLNPSDGSVMWTNIWGSSGADVGEGVAIDDAGNIHFAGYL